MVSKIKLLVLPLVASALFFHGASHSVPQTDMNQASVDQATTDQANVNLTDGATDNWGWYGGYGLYGYNPYMCDWYPYSAGCYGIGYGLGYGWGWGGWGWGGRGRGGRGGHHGGHHRR